MPDPQEPPLADDRAGAPGVDLSDHVPLRVARQAAAAVLGDLRRAVGCDSQR